LGVKEVEEEEMKSVYLRRVDESDMILVGVRLMCGLKPIVPVAMVHGDWLDGLFGIEANEIFGDWLEIKIMLVED